MYKKSILRVITLVLMASLLFSMVACDTEKNENSEAASNANSETASNTSAAEVEEPASFGWTKTLDLATGGVVKTSGIALTGDPTQIKIGVILVGDDTEGYTKAHIDGIKAAAAKLGITDSQILWKYKVPESEEVVTNADQLYAEGCRLIITNSYGHQDFTEKAAEKYSDAQFVALTGDQAAAYAAGGTVTNLSNAFTDVYESRYVSGVVAGLKLKELVDNGTLTKEKLPNSFDANGNIKIGYVGAFSYAEVMSGYTAFFLGIKSIVSNVSMEVYYTKSWFDFDAEKSAAQTFIDKGCVIIGQHADSSGAPTAIETANKEGKVVFSVGYNVTMLDAAPTAALTSATNVWEVYYEYAFATVINGGKLDTNWSAGYNEGAVAITDLGPACAAGTKEYVDNVIGQIKAGTLHVFDTSKFTYKGKTLTWAYGTDSDGNFANDCNNLIADGYFHESYVQSAPAFSILIDGITEVNQGY